MSFGVESAVDSDTAAYAPRFTASRACAAVIGASETHIQRDSPRGAAGGLPLDVQTTRGSELPAPRPRSIVNRASFSAVVSARDGGVPSHLMADGMTLL